MSIQNIGANIARMRKAKGATQEELARAAGVSAQLVYKFNPQPYFMGFLLFAYDMIKRPTRFWYNSQHRSKPYLT